MTETTNKNPFNVRFTEITMTKFNGSDKINITPQVAEFTLYQSLFSPLIKADLVITDQIGLMVNYPLSGEEFVDVYLEQKTGTTKRTRKLQFVIMAIKDISFSDTARQTLYRVELISREAFINAKTRVSHAYNDTIEDMIQKLYDQYIKSEKQIKFLNATKKVRYLVVPNLKPLDAINWLCKFAVAENSGAYYTFMFYETLDGFVFKPLQRPTFKDAVDDNAFLQSEKEKYFYISNLELLTNNQETYNKFVQEGFNETRTINDLVINKRYTTLEKIIGGYFENELVEVNMLQKDHLITKTALPTNIDPRNRSSSFTTLQRGTYNTKDYIKNVREEYENDETSARVRYIINNYDDLNQPSYRDKFGNSARSFLAYQQLDLSVSVHSNLDMNIGDVLSARFPEMHGFNNTTMWDEYLSGYFVVSEIKTVIKAGDFSQSYVRLNKDSFAKKLEAKTKYQFNVPTDWDTQRR